MWLTDLADVLRAAGLVVRENPSWRTRGYDGRGLDAVRGVVIHHTAEPESADPAVMARFLGIGRSDLAGPLCHAYVDRAGTWWCVAAGWANHAGSGWWPGLSGNADCVGVEAANDGVDEPWPDRQLDSWVVGVAAICDRYDVPADKVIKHAEWAPERKKDPSRISGGVFRASVAEEMRMALSDQDLEKIRRVVAETLGGWPITWPDPTNPQRLRSGNQGIVDSVWHAVADGDKLVDVLIDARRAAENVEARPRVDVDAAAVAEAVVGHLGDDVARLVADEIFRRMEA